MLESFRHRFSTKDKKPNAFIEPNEGWEIFVTAMKELSSHRKECFAELNRDISYKVGEYGKRLDSVACGCDFSDKYSLIEAMSAVAKWSYYVLSDDHSVEPNTFQFTDISQDEDAGKDPFKNVNVYITQINQEWDLLLWHSYYNKTRFILPFLCPKFTEADRK